MRDRIEFGVKVSGDKAERADDFIVKSQLVTPDGNALETLANGDLVVPVATGGSLPDATEGQTLRKGTTEWAASNVLIDDETDYTAVRMQPNESAEDRANLAFDSSANTSAYLELVSSQPYLSLVKTDSDSMEGNDFLSFFRSDLSYEKIFAVDYYGKIQSDYLAGASRRILYAEANGDIETNSDMVGASGTFETTDGKVITVTDGIITNIASM